MKYLSTRDDSLSRSFNDILYQGLSRDGGLYLPQSWPKIDLLSLKNKSYEEVACEIIFPYVNGIFLAFEPELFDITERIASL